MTDVSKAPAVAIVGGGLAGLSAGTALATAGFRVTLFERKPYLGGRASSYEHPGTGEVVDNCQHVLLGCCTNLVDFYRRIGAEHLVRWYDRLTFVEPGGRRSVIKTSWLPAPLHAAPSFLMMSAVSWRDKIAISRALAALLRRLPPDNGRPFSDWLRTRRQTSAAINHFWKVVLVSALNEELDCVSTPTAALVFRESFIKSTQGGRMGVPRVPLTELYSKAGEYISEHAGVIQLRSPVASFEPIEGREPGDGAAVFASRPGVRLCAEGKPRMFDYAVLAVPFDALGRLLPQTPEAEPLAKRLSQFETSPITGVHLWFDKEIADLDHAVLLDRTIQWMFNKSRILDTGIASSGRRSGNRKPEVGNSPPGSYLELVISSSKSLVNKSRQEVIDVALDELAEFFPAVRSAQLEKATVIKEINATFSPSPGIDAHRPTAVTPWSRLFLAGDWTATGWPATMEGAVRSGYRAAEAVCRAAGQPQSFLMPDLPASGLMRLFGR